MIALKSKGVKQITWLLFSAVKYRLQVHATENKQNRVFFKQGLVVAHTSLTKMMKTFFFFLSGCKLLRTVFFVGAYNFNNLFRDLSMRN